MPLLAILFFLLELVTLIGGSVLAVLKMLSVQPVASSWSWVEVGLVFGAFFVVLFLNHIAFDG